MARKSAGKLVAKQPRGGVSAGLAAEAGDGEEWGDAAALIRSLTAEREGAEFNVKVYSVIGGIGRGAAGRQQFLFEVQLDDLPNLEQTLAQEFPQGGLFRVAIRADNQLIKNPLLDIAPRPGYRAPPPSYIAPVAAPPQTVPGGSSFENLLTQMVEGQRKTQEAILALAARPVPPAPTLQEQLQLFQTFSSLLPRATQENTMEMFQKGMDFAKNAFELARGTDSGGSNWVDVMRDLLSSPTIKEMVTAALASPPQAGGAPQLTGPVAAPAGFVPLNVAPVGPVAPAAAPGLVLHKGNPQAAAAIQALIFNAQSGTDPKLIVEQVSSMVPEAILEELERQEDIVGFIIQQFPEAAAHRAWFAALIAEIFETDQSAAPAGTFANANAGNTDSVKPEG